MQQITPQDKLILLFDNAVKTLFGGAQVSSRANPMAGVAAGELDATEKKHAAGLMRVNHCGEVCAQALYQGQALTAKLPKVRAKMEQAAIEENDHLDWCETRIKQLDSHTSFLNPLWYAGSFTIGAVAGAVGDKWSLGFVAETERQVVAHLEGHLGLLPQQDKPSQAILAQMKIDEQQHADTAIAAGGSELPKPIKDVMQLLGKVMTSTAYYV
ncbi:2-polyprenyl-3-methyl-6-methoxy-1,4-benzoquinone monooxygenase [Aliikangiella sp. IMCC44653]